MPRPKSGEFTVVGPTALERSGLLELDDQYGWVVTARATGHMVVVRAAQMEDVQYVTVVQRPSANDIREVSGEEVNVLHLPEPGITIDTGGQDGIDFYRARTGNEPQEMPGAVTAFALASAEWVLRLSNGQMGASDGL